MNARMIRLTLIGIAIAVLTAQIVGCSRSGDSPAASLLEPEPVNLDTYTIQRTLSDGGQLNTIAFDGLAFLTNNLGAQSFIPPGKVADFCGFQYLRDNDPTEMGHNTDFVTIIAFNVMHILTDEQLNLMIEAAREQVNLINEHTYKRFPLMKAFRRLLENDLPETCTELDKEEVTQYSADLYRIDGEISYKRTELLGGIMRSMNSTQITAFSDLKGLNGAGNWNRNLNNPLTGYNLPKEVNVVVMTLASEMYSWYSGSVEADTYFCPERQGTYFGSFYLKDWPAMGNPDYTIDEQLTARAGENFLNILTEEQKNTVTNLVAIQKTDLHAIVDCREQISSELRKFMSQETIDQGKITSLSEQYGELDGAIVYQYAVKFTEVSRSLSDAQRNELLNLVTAIGYLHPDGAFLYSDPITMPEIINTDFFFK